MLVCSFNFPSRPELVPIRRVRCGGHDRAYRVPCSCFAPAVSAGVSGFLACGERKYSEFPASGRDNRRSAGCPRGTLYEIVSNRRRSRVWSSYRADRRIAVDIRPFWEHARDSSRSRPGRCSQAEHTAVSAGPSRRARRTPESRPRSQTLRSPACERHSLYSRFGLIFSGTSGNMPKHRCSIQSINSEQYQ